MNCAIDDSDPHRRGNQGIQRCLDTIKTLVEKVLLKSKWSLITTMTVEEYFHSTSLKWTQLPLPCSCNHEKLPQLKVSLPTGDKPAGWGSEKREDSRQESASWPIYFILGLFSGPTNPKNLFFYYYFCIHPSPSFYHLHSRKEPSLPASKQKPFSSLRSTPFRGDVAFFARLENTLSRQMLYCRVFSVWLFSCSWCDGHWWSMTTGHFTVVLFLRLVLHRRLGAGESD